MSTDLVQFLLDRIREDENVAEVAVDRWRDDDQGDLDGWRWYSNEAASNGDQIVAVGPLRALAECNAKREMVSEWRGYGGAGDWYDRPLRWLAVAYANHPDYNPEWAIS